MNKSVAFIYIYLYVRLCMFVCICVYILIYLFKHHNMHREDGETENPASPALRVTAIACQAWFLLIMPDLSLLENHL